MSQAFFLGVSFGMTGREKHLAVGREPCGIDAVGESDSFGSGTGKPRDGTRRTLV